MNISNLNSGVALCLRQLLAYPYASAILDRCPMTQTHFDDNKINIIIEEQVSKPYSCNKLLQPYPTNKLITFNSECSACGATVVVLK